MARGKKTCPKCNTVNGARTHNCKSCNTEFVAKVVEIRDKKKKKKEKLIEKIDPKIQALLDSLPDCSEIEEEKKKTSPKEHAKRVLSYGKKTASFLLRMAQSEGYWKHVDWKVVEAGL
ncbi:unnamed protein product [marine sediment metagenome]|uniref:Uncharacterized protein n=1 Tax=marine sediment metagenome TaxID=412755 RepID=X0T7L6_9ZZZZ